MIVNIQNVKTVNKLQDILSLIQKRRYSLKNINVETYIFLNSYYLLNSIYEDNT